MEISMIYQWKSNGNPVQKNIYANPLELKLKFNITIKKIRLIKQLGFQFWSRISYLVSLPIVSYVLLLRDLWQEGELRVVHAGVQLLVQGLEVIQCPPDHPASVKWCIYRQEYLN